MKLNMNYSIEQLSNGRWGLKAETRLLATIGCHETGLKILTLLKTGKVVKARHQQLSSLIAKTGLTTQAA